MKDAIELAELWVDSPHVSHFRNRRPRSLMPKSQATVITYPRTGCLDSCERRVSVALKRIACDEHKFIEGVSVQRTSAHGVQTFYVNGERVTLDFEAAVREVIARSGEREVAG